MESIFSRVYQHFTSDELKPSGWLKKQLRIQADGLSGHLDQMWPDVKESAWIGGEKEGWERVPYWLDGFVPMAYLLEDEDLIGRARRYIDAILAAQEEDGWICPCPPDQRARYDLWAVFLICKALMVYGECSGDPRAEKAVYRAMFQLKDHLRHWTLAGWGQSRWFEGLIPLAWLYEKQPEDWMLDLAVTLRTQGLDYETLFACWRDQEPKRSWTQQTHIVNLMMAVKAEAVFSGLSGKDPNAFAHKMLAKLRASHGAAVGHIIGDECLGGRSPVRGAELCSIVEAMYSCEVLAEITGDPFWMDWNEELAFNNLPATISEDMWTHQYLQMENQIACTVQEQPPIFGTNSAESNVFGLEPNYGCCTADFSQGWPKFALSTFLKTEAGILSALLAPSRLHTQLNGQPVEIELETNYPFEDTLLYRIRCEKETEFDFSIRIPGFVRCADVDGEKVQPGTVYTIRRQWKGEMEIRVRLDMECQFVQRPDEMAALRRGPLFFALPIQMKSSIREYVRNDVERKFPYCDYDHLPASEWQYAFGSDQFEVIRSGVGQYPFSRLQPPVQLRTMLAKIDWGTHPGQPNVCAPTPASHEKQGEETVLLQPYGCTTLRMTVMPVVK